MEFSKWPKDKRAIHWARHLEAVETSEANATNQLQFLRMESELFEEERNDQRQPPHIHDMARRALIHIALEIEGEERLLEESRLYVAHARRALEATNSEADQ